MTEENESTEGERVDGELVEPDEELDLSAMLEQAQEMLGIDLSQVEKVSETEITGSAGGGAVSVVMQNGEFRSIRIDPSVVDPKDVGMLEDLVLAALNDCTAKMGELMPPMPDLGSLFGSD